MSAHWIPAAVKLMCGKGAEATRYSTIPRTGMAISGCYGSPVFTTMVAWIDPGCNFSRMKYTLNKNFSAPPGTSVVA